MTTRIAGGELVERLAVVAQRRADRGRAHHEGDEHRPAPAEHARLRDVAVVDARRADREAAQERLGGGAAVLGGEPEECDPALVAPGEPLEEGELLHAARTPRRPLG
jgi:hypothetical protein